MGLFRTKNRPRTCIDVRVGNSHILEVLVQMRRAEWSWYLSNAEAVTEEFLELLEGSVISRMFGNELEEYHHERNPGVVPPDAAATVGLKNKKTKKKTNSSEMGKGGKNHPQHGASTKKATTGKSVDENNDDNKMMTKDIFYSYGELIQLAYRWQPLATGQNQGFSTSHKTILFEKEQNGSTVVGFRDYPKLSHRLLVWISKATSPEQRNNPDPIGFGFVRPEMIPVSRLFRKPKEFLEEEDGDDDQNDS